jgi:hypothetical protein
VSGTVYDKLLPPEQAPHVVECDAAYGVGGFYGRRAWLAENGVGRYAWSRAFLTEPHRYIIKYRFTDADTAFWFKMVMR